MTESQSSQPLVHEADLHDLIRLIGRRFKLVLLITLIGALAGAAIFFFIKPAQSAVAVITVDPAMLVSSTSPYYLVQNDEIANAVAQKLGIALEDLPDMSFSVDKTDKSVITIEADANNEALAMNAANTWAEAAVEWLRDNSNSIAENLAEAQTAAETADTDLAQFLQTNGWENLNWVDLVAITGIDDNDNISIIADQKTLPQLTIAQKAKLSQLVRQKVISEWNYLQVSKASITAAQNSNQRIMILNKALQTEEKYILGGAFAIPVGMILGVFIACAWILLADWWKNPARSD